MDWPEHLINHMREQEQLNVARALIEDATRDALLWMESASLGNSAEEWVHVLAMQETLVNLGRIVERRIKGRHEVRDAWEWIEGVPEVLSRLEQARELRGGIVGKGLSRIPEHLLRQLPGLKAMDLIPREFPPEARDRIEKERIRTSRELLPSNVYDSKDQDLAVQCIMRIFLAFAKEVCALREKHGWTLDRVQREAEEFLRGLTITVVFTKFPGLDRHWISNRNGSIAPDVERRFKASPEWKQYEGFLLASPLNDTAQGSLVQNNANSAQSADSKLTDRRSTVKAYIEEVRGKTGRRITKKDIWKEAGYQTRTEFERWERQDPKHRNKAAEENFARILREKPHLK
jgi:hypothetical protein